ncbi:hypothetical protein ANN_05227 [Periplaneta americana]|uniref:Uncharacterized protein n=1 Tax=Periplaneta americana TaxID=6978 RepID=A0ABQ8TC91_PERAM|nr:hypothetical protein ANN_05227 [Periplaneta americana]
MEHVKWTDRIRNESVLERVGEEKMMLKLIRKRKRNWLGHYLRRICLLKDAMDGMVNGKRVRGRRRYQMIDDIKIYQGPSISQVFARRHICAIYSTNKSVDRHAITGSPTLERIRDGATMKPLLYDFSLLVRYLLFLKKKKNRIKPGVVPSHNAPVNLLEAKRNIKSRRLRWAGPVARMGESRNAYRGLLGRPEGKRPLGRPRRRWEDNIKMDLREVGYDDREWINLAQDRDQWRACVRMAMNLRLSFAQRNVLPLHISTLSIFFGKISSSHKPSDAIHAVFSSFFSSSPSLRSPLQHHLRYSSIFHPLQVNTRHHAIRDLIAKSLPSFYEVRQEVHCLAKDGISLQVDIIAIDRGNDRAIIIDPTVRFETAVEQPVAVHEGMKTIYDPTIQYLRDYSFVGDNAGEMSPGSSTESYPAFARIGLRENPGKNLNQVTCPDRDSNPGHLVSRPDALTVTPQVKICLCKRNGALDSVSFNDLGLRTE